MPSDNLPNSQPQPCEMYEAILTFIPNGRKGRQLTGSVHVAPRLKCPGTLAQYVTSFVDWPRLVQQLSFRIWFKDGEKPHSTKAPPIGVPIKLVSPQIVDSKLWHSIFPPTTIVQAYELDPFQYIEKAKSQTISPPLSDLKRSIISPLYREHIDRSQFGIASYSDLRTRLEKFGLMLSHNEEMMEGDKSSKTPQRMVRAGSSTKVQFDALKQLHKSRRVERRNSNAERPKYRQFIPSSKPLILPKDLREQLKGKQLQLLRANTFFTYKAFTQAQVRRDVSPPADKKEKDQCALSAMAEEFHSRVAAAGDYPELMRRLGLVLDFIIEDPGISESGYCWIEAMGNNIIPSSWICPRVFFSETFQCRSGDEDPEIHDGHLLLGRPLMTREGDKLVVVKDRTLNETVLKFDVISSDVLGVTKKLELLLEKISNEPAKNKQAALPAQRAIGLAVVYRERDAWFLELMERRNALQAKLTTEKKTVGVRGTSLFLYAEDLVRGIRIDVREVRRKDESGVAAGPWRSLCMRHGKYFLNRSSDVLFEHSDEGWISLAVMDGREVASDEGEKPSPTILINGELFRWSGWGLCVPKPRRENLVKTDERQCPVEPPFRTVFSSVKGSLPKLRFGRQYQFRARVVDLTGNSPEFKPSGGDNDETVTDINDGHYGRLDPVPSPLLLFTTQPDKIIDRETKIPSRSNVLDYSIDRMVIRTANPGTSSEIAADPLNAMDERHVLPPKCELQIAEAHGMLDDIKGNIRGDAIYRILVEKDQTGSKSKIDNGSVSTLQVITVPFLADPMAKGISCQLVRLGKKDHAADSPMLHHLFPGEWPNQRSLKIRLEGGTKLPQISGSTCTFYVPVGEQATLRLSSRLRKSDEDQFELWREVEGRVKGEERDHKRLEILEGRNSMVSPYREVQLIHATQQPVITPAWEVFFITRGFLETHITLYGRLRMHRQSTGEIAIAAKWNEEIAEKSTRESKKDPASTPHKMLVNKISVSLISGIQKTEVKTQNKAPSDHPSFVNSTFEMSLDEFANLEQSVQVRDVIKAVDHVRKVPNNKKLKQDLNRDNGERIAFALGRQEFGDTKFRRVIYEASAISRYEKYFMHSPVSKEPPSYSRRMAPQIIIVPNSAPPPVPEVQYVIPTFRWAASSGKSQRKGGGLRVYLGSTWNCSGEGELLAVVLGPSTQGRVASDLHAFYTLWGMDPLWMSLYDSPKARGQQRWTQPRPGDFLNHREVRSDLGVEIELSQSGQAGGPVVPHTARATICAFEVLYDSGRQLWYCDIDINPSSTYFPFIRLAFTRYQPISLKSAHLSKPFLVDFAQLLPDRSVTLTKGKKDDFTIVVSGVQPSITSSRATVMELHFEYLEGDLSQDLGWLPAPDYPPLALIRNHEQQVWVGVIRITHNKSRVYRGVVKEFEQYEVSGERGTKRILERRLVYAQPITLPR